MQSVTTQIHTGSATKSGYALSSDRVTDTAIPFEGLLKRNVFPIDVERVMAALSGARVLVTGAGGSIGSALCRQLTKYSPSDLILVGHGENSIFDITSELRTECQKDSKTHVHSIVANIRDRDRMDFVFQVHRPHVVYHTAAHKHIGLMEANEADAVTNNVLGTQVIVELAAQYGVERLVMISSEKAGRPTSVMGVTKRVAELVVLHAARRTGRAFVTVRLGNVLGSRGGVVSVFQRQIAAGGPVQVTHPDASRCFVTIPEAVQVLLQATTMGRGGEVFVLDMGKPVRIQDLAQDLIRLNGKEEGSDIRIEFVGLRKGEKIHEDPPYGRDTLMRSVHDKIMVHTPSSSRAFDHRFGEHIDSLVASAQHGDLRIVEECLKKIVPEYLPADIASDSVSSNLTEKPALAL